MGYFAALYRRVTVEVKGRMDKGHFVDPARMEALDAVFANRYLDAYHRYRCGEGTTRAWTYAFTASADPEPTVLQHLLMGMNAHISLDLGIAAAEVALEHPGEGFKVRHASHGRIDSLISETSMVGVRGQREVHA